LLATAVATHYIEVIGTTKGTGIQMAFTANEMVTAISNHVANSYMENRFERAAFAAFLADEYGADRENAAQCLAWLAEGTVWYEDGVVTYLYRDLMEHREQQDR
jgi:hypothetical protein